MNIFAYKVECDVMLYSYRVGHRDESITILLEAIMHVALSNKLK